MVVACTTHVLFFFSSLTFSLFLLHSHLSSSSEIVDMFVYGRGATKQERCRVRFRSPQPVVDLYRCTVLRLMYQIRQTLMCSLLSYRHGIAHPIYTSQGSQNLRVCVRKECAKRSCWIGKG
ncbi:hypothetical protein YC2023_002699 [Brassica napus]